MKGSLLRESGLHLEAAPGQAGRAGQASEGRVGALHSASSSWLTAKETSFSQAEGVCGGWPPAPMGNYPRPILHDVPKVLRGKSSCQALLMASSLRVQKGGLGDF